MTLAQSQRALFCAVLRCSAVHLCCRPAGLLLSPNVFGSLHNCITLISFEQISRRNTLAVAHQIPEANHRVELCSKIRRPVPSVPSVPPLGTSFIYTILLLKPFLVVLEGTKGTQGTQGVGGGGVNLTLTGEVEGVGM